MTEHGALVIADISGYTKFVGGVELEHGTAIVGDLLDVVVDQLAAIGSLAKLEGDAAFCASTTIPSGDATRSALYACYDAFRRRLRDAAHLTTCTCEACVQMSSLDLKIILHTGDYVTHQVAGRTEVAGSDVILVHRLLKNSIDSTGYALITDTAAKDIRLPLADWGYQAEVEEVDDVGSIGVHVLDLAELWAAEQERTSVLVPLEGSHILTYELPAPVPVVWDWLSDPHKRRQWNGARSIDTEESGGPSAVGTVNHCVHGKSTITEEIVDWKPFDHCTFRNKAPFGTFLFTADLKPTDAGTRVQLRFQPEPGRLNALKFGMAFKVVMKPNTDKGIARLHDLIRVGPPDI
jgi:uncharacterized protein YndB with AHSA1/START domain